MASMAKSRGLNAITSSVSGMLKVPLDAGGLNAGAQVDVVLF